MTPLDLQFITYVDLPMMVNSTSDPIFTYTFEQNYFGDDQKILSTCRSLLNFNNDPNQTFFYMSRAYFYTFPKPTGQFTVFRTKPNQFFFTLDGFNPVFGPTPEQFLNKQGIFLNSSLQINLTKVLEEIYLPYIYVLVYENTCDNAAEITIQNPITPIWELISYDQINNITLKQKFEVAYDTCFIFELKVWNQWTPGVIYKSQTFVVSPVGDAASVEYYVNKLRYSEPDSIKSVMNQMESKFKAMRVNQETNYCLYGQLNTTTLQCMCLKQKNYQYINDYVNKTRTAFRVLFHLFQTQEPDFLLHGATDLIVYYTNNTCALLDESILQNTTLFILDILVMKARLTQVAITNLIISIINIHDSWTQLTMYSDRRILDRLQTKSESYYGPQGSSYQQNSSQSDILDLSSNYMQYINDVDILLHTALYILSDITSEEIHIQQGQIELIMFTIQKSIHPPSSYDFMLGNIQVHLPFFSTGNYIKHDDKLILMLIRKTQEPWMMNTGVKLLNDQYLQGNIISQQHGMLFTTPTLDFQIFFTFTDDSLLGSESCVYYNKDQLFWSTKLVSTIDDVGSIQCQSNHLSEFSISPSLGLPYNIYIAYKTNTRIGWLNLIIILLIFSVSLAVFGILNHFIFNAKDKLKKLDPKIITIKEVDEEHNVSIEKVIDKVRQIERRPSIEDEIEIQELDKKVVGSQELESQKPTNEVQLTKQNTLPFKMEDVVVNNGPILIEFDGQSQQEIIMHPGKNTQKNKFSNVYNYICCLFPKPASWAPSQLRICVIFLWFSCYQLIFAALLTVFSYSQLTLDFISIAFITMIISNFVNYFFALIVFMGCKCDNSFFVFRKNLIITFMIILNLGLVIKIYSNLALENLQRYHVENAAFQILFNMIWFDLFMEFVSMKIKFLRMMRKFKVIEFE